MDYKAFEDWVKAKPRRHCAIDIGSPSDNQYVRVWVYDYDLMVGQHVTSVEEIDLESVRKKELEAKIAELQKLTAKKTGLASP